MLRFLDVIASLEDMVQLIKSCLDPVSWKLTSTALEKSNLQRICFSILAHIPFSIDVMISMCEMNGLALVIDSTCSICRYIRPPTENCERSKECKQKT